MKPSKVWLTPTLYMILRASQASQSSPFLLRGIELELGKHPESIKSMFMKLTECFHHATNNDIIDYFCKLAAMLVYKVVYRRGPVLLYTRILLQGSASVSVSGGTHYICAASGSILNIRSS